MNEPTCCIDAREGDPWQTWVWHDHPEMSVAAEEVGECVRFPPHTLLDGQDEHDEPVQLGPERVGQGLAESG